MIERIVKMTFRAAEAPAFEKIFREVSPDISKFKGCRGVRLLKDQTDPRIYFTFSTWDDESALDNYRKSDFFKGTWQRTKSLFEEPAQAWTTLEMLK